MIYIISPFKTGTNTVLASIISNSGFHSEFSLEEKIGKFVHRSHTDYDLIKDIFSRRSYSHVITVIRDPISQYISGFFQDITTPPFNFGSQEDVEQADTKDLYNFFNQFDFDQMEAYSLDMLFEYYKELWGFDILKHSFERERGITTYQIKNKFDYTITLSVLRMDKLNSAIPLLGNKLNIHNLQIVNSNIGTTKWYSQYYKNFKQFVKTKGLPKIEQFMDQAYVNFFYSKQERNEMKSYKWL